MKLGMESGVEILAQEKEVPQVLVFLEHVEHVEPRAPKVVPDKHHFRLVSPTYAV
jgi:hypothetical protein